MASLYCAIMFNISVSMMSELKVVYVDLHIAQLFGTIIYLAYVDGELLQCPMIR